MGLQVITNVIVRKWSVRVASSIMLSAVVSAELGCSSSSTGSNAGATQSEVSGQIIYNRFRDASANVVPVFSEASGFDAGEVDSPNIMLDKSRVAGDRFMMFYEAQDLSGTNTIGFVTSDEEDFVVLSVPRTQVIGLGATGSGYSTGATDPTALLDKRPTEAARRYKMWFEGRDGSSSTVIFATSTDGITWVGFTKCTGLTPSFGSVRVADPSVTLSGSLYQMWFEAINTTVGGKDGPAAIGYAESPDGVNWTIKDASGNTGSSAGSVFGKGATGQFDAYSVNAPSVVIDTSIMIGAPERFKLWYEAADNGADVQNTIGYATSSDGLTWSRAALPVLVPSSDLKTPLPFDSGDLEHPTALIIYTIPAALDGHFLLWYTGDGEAGFSPNRIGLVKGSSI